MAEKSTFFNSVNGDRKYKTENIVAHFAQLITNGVYPAGTQLQATEDSGMNVIVSAGSAWINGYAYHNDSDFTLSFDVADGVLNRIDRIVVRWGRLARSINLVVIKGTPASTPAAPAIVRSADYYDLGVATVSIGKGITAITQAMITDTRLDSNVCGLVSSLIQPDTTGWFTQFDSAFNAALSGNQTAWDTWFDSIKNIFEDTISDNQSAWDIWFATIQDILDENTAGNLLNLINTNAGDISDLEDDFSSHKNESATLEQPAHVEHGVITVDLDTTWTGSAAPYIKEQNVTGILATDKPIVDLVFSGMYGVDKMLAEEWSKIYRITTSNGSIKMFAHEKPTQSLTLQLKVVR